MKKPRINWKKPTQEIADKLGVTRQAVEQRRERLRMGLKEPGRPKKAVPADIDWTEKNDVLAAKHAVSIPTIVRWRRAHKTNPTQ